MANILVTAMCPQLISDALKEAKMPNGIVFVAGEVNIKANKKSFQENIMQYKAEATIPGIESGKATRKKDCQWEAPSTRAASSISCGTP